MSDSTTMHTLIRPMIHADLEIVLAWRNHSDVRRYMISQHEIKHAEHLSWFNRTLQDPKKHLLIFETNHEPQGFVNFNEVGNGGVAEWGFYTAPDAPKGRGRQLGNAALTHAFAQLELHKVCGRVLAFNARSINFHLELGFLQEGIMRDNHFDGVRYHHVISFGLLSNDWQLSK